MQSRNKSLLMAYIFIIPSMVLLVLLILHPIFKVTMLSFQNVTLITKNPSFVGFQNYLDIFKSAVFWKIFRNSVLWTAIVVLFQFILGLSSALFLNHKKIAGRGIIRTLVLIPWVIPGVIIGIIWKLMYNPQIGIISALLERVGIANNFAILANGNTALLGVIIVAIWKGFPFSTVTYLAALQSVRGDLLEAAMIDGANFFQKLFHVILPALSTIIRITLMLTTIWTFNYFDIIYTMTNGGPNNETQIFPLEIYNQAFTQFKFSYASTFAVISLIIILFFSLFFIREQRRAGSDV